MKRVMVRYTVKPERAAENERYIEQVFAELARVAPAGVQYTAFELDDGVTFVHLYAHEGDDGAGLLPTLAAFQAFRAGLNERCEAAPVRTVLHEVGSYASAVTPSEVAVIPSEVAVIPSEVAVIPSEVEGSALGTAGADPSTRFARSG